MFERIYLSPEPTTKEGKQRRFLDECLFRDHVNTEIRRAKIDAALWKMYGNNEKAKRRLRGGL